MEEEWTCDANDAITVSLVTPAESGFKTLESFHPNFTYPIFGEEEQIFGYKNLKVNLYYNATDMRPHLAMSSAKKFPSIGEVEPFNVVEEMKEYLPGVAFQKKADYEMAIKSTLNNWTPPGELVRTIERNGETYEVWKGSLADDAVKQLVKRIQILVLFHIEGGSYIGEDADGKEDPEYSLARWNVFFIYKKQAVSGAEGQYQYIFHGYSTVYNFWLLQTPTPPTSPGKAPALIEPKTDDSWELPHGEVSYSEFPHRARISQFLILPPFQGKGVGAMLYNTIFDLESKNEATKEITVEDPNEAFDLLRDVCDMKYLRKNVPEFANLAVNPDVTVPEKGAILHHNTQVSIIDDQASTSTKGIVDVEALEKLRQRVKIAPRQFWRLVEMHLMSKLPALVRPEPEGQSKQKTAPKADKHLYMLWRILLKQRLYRRNISILGEFEITERILKLNETLDNVEWEYARILERLEAAPVAQDEGASANGKRKAGDREDSLAKRPKLEEAE